MSIAKEKVPTQFVCAVTGRTAKSKSQRLPPQWKRRPDGTVLSPEGWQSLFVAASIVVPISGPLDSKEWPELRTCLRSQWGATTRLANWAVRQIALIDVVRKPGEDKLGPIPKFYLYPDSHAIAPELPAGVRAQVLRNAEQRYKEDRYKVVWQGSQSLSSFRYPVPVPLREADYTLDWVVVREGADPLPCISVRLGDRRWKLRIRQGPGTWRALATLKRALAGEVVLGAASLYEKTAHENDNRTESLPKRQLYLRVSVHIPKAATPDPEAEEVVLSAKTGADFLLQAQLGETPQPWTLRVAHVKRWIAEYDRRRQYLSDDLKAERRRPKKNRRDMDEAHKAWTNKHHHRLDSLLHEVSAQLVGYARRRKATKIVLDDSDRRFVASFPWATLRQRIAYKAEYHGIVVEFTTTEAPAAEEE